ncbi:MAG: metallophosphatase family protein, partial [Terrimicrobiaceae bacterium]|nr:metallophosphatase family protein [Terrimicrobiaceae bacterium]
MAANGGQVKAGVLRVAVVADTHGRFPETLREELNSADEIWHLGDFCDAACLEAFRRLDPPLRAVLG